MDLELLLTVNPLLTAKTAHCSHSGRWRVLGEIPSSISLDNPSTQIMREIAQNYDTKIKELKQL